MHDRNVVFYQMSSGTFAVWHEIAGACTAHTVFDVNRTRDRAQPQDCATRSRIGPHSAECPQPAEADISPKKANSRFDPSGPRTAFEGADL